MAARGLFWLSEWTVRLRPKRLRRVQLARHGNNHKRLVLQSGGWDLGLLMHLDRCLSWIRPMTGPRSCIPPRLRQRTPYRVQPFSPGGHAIVACSDRAVECRAVVIGIFGTTRTSEVVTCRDEVGRLLVYDRPVAASGSLPGRNGFRKRRSQQMSGLPKSRHRQHRAVSQRPAVGDLVRTRRPWSSRTSERRTRACFEGERRVRYRCAFSMRSPDTSGQAR